ncbi:MAG: hypothetical protein ACRDHF_05005 [Tepidiformaceae bacterium]
MSATRAAACVLSVLVAATAAIGGFAFRPQPAHACSLAGLQLEFLPYFLEESTIVAVGRLTDAKQTEITLEVEEGLKGSRAGDRLTLNNRHFGLGGNCSVYVVPTSGGYALPEEARVIAFLQPDLSQKPDFWMPSLYGYAIYEVESSDKPFGADDWLVDGIVQIGEHREAFAPHAQLPFEPTLEDIPPCNYIGINANNAETLSRMSQAIAVASVVKVEGMVATFATEEVWRGNPGATFTVNASHFHHQENSCDLAFGGGPRFEEGQRLLVLLFPDEFGVAQYRLANWGAGGLLLRGEWVSQGLPALQDVRDLLAAGVGTAAPPSNADRIKDGVLLPEFVDRMHGDEDQPDALAPAAQRDADDDGSRPAAWMLPLALAGAVAVAGVAAVALYRRRRD